MNRTEPNRGALSTAALLAAALAVIALTGAVAADRPIDGRGDLAMATVYAGGVDFLPTVAYSGAKITVSGATMIFERSFGPGEPLSIDMFDPDGQLLPDGTYTWRLALTPTASDARQLRRSARRNGGTAPDRWLAQSGAFSIRNGLMEDPSLAEARPARAASSLAAALPQDLAAPAGDDRIADDGDAAVATGAAPSPNAVSPSANKDQADAIALTAAPAPRALSEDRPTVRRSYPTDGKNGRE